MSFHVPEPDPRRIRLAERIGMDPSQTTDIRADYEGEDDVVRVTATVVVGIPLADFLALWNGEPE